jgi:hypothetical protein
MQNRNIVVAAALTVATVAAHAALPTEAASAFTAISTNVTDVLAVVWPIVGMLTGGFVLIKLFKKGASKAV